MRTYTIQLELPEKLYRSARQMAAATQRPLADIVQESLAHTLPPLDDLSPEEAAVLAHLLADEQQQALSDLLELQNERVLTKLETRRLHELMDHYGRMLVWQSHIWLLLARRGYRVPMQTASE
jgi:hypothetical protein